MSADHALNRAVTGCSHTTGGRVLPRKVSVLDHEGQEARIAADPKAWQKHSLHEPLSSGIDGARSYAHRLGLSDPHDIDYHAITTNPDMVRKVGRAYDSLPDKHPGAKGAFDAMRREVGQQFHHLTHSMGVKVSFVSHDPYKHAGEMLEDARSGRLQVLKTSTTGGHPIFSDHENDQFRAVHDYFGHAATGRDFDRHGEEAAFVAHSKMFTPAARPAMAAETKGQNSSFILNGDFPKQKQALLAPQLWTPSTKKDYGRTAMRKQAHDSGDGETIYHCPFCGSGQVIARSDRTIECQFCHVAFTVQVQPQYPAFPQTINGMPVQVPGMPGQVDPAGSGMGDPMPGGPAEGGLPPDVEDPDAPMDPEDLDDEGEDDEDEGGGNPFAKGSSRSYVTRAGHVLAEDDFVKHLAIRHSAQPQVTAGRLRDAR